MTKLKQFATSDNDWTDGDSGMSAAIEASYRNHPSTILDMRDSKGRFWRASITRSLGYGFASARADNKAAERVVTFLVDGSALEDLPAARSVHQTAYCRTSRDHVTELPTLLAMVPDKL